VHGWDAFRHGTRNTAAGAASNEIIRVFSTMVPATKARELVAAQFLQKFSQMVLDRNKRYVHATEALSPIMWVGIIIGGILTIGLSFIIFMERGWPHVLGVAVMSTLIGMLLFMVALLSRPFHGPLAIDPAPFEQVLAVFDQVDKGQ
jgi:formate-dependent nitrite reductase membrane component NrfD